MTASEKKSNRSGILGTMVFHILLIICFLYMGLTYQTPPPEEEGISINFGYIDEGKTEIEPSDESEIPEPVEEEIIVKEALIEQEILTQENEESAKIEKDKKEKQDSESEKEELIEEKPEIIKKALYTGKKKNQESNEGRAERNGNQGDIDGTPNTEKYTGGGMGSDGIAYQLGGRKPEFKAKPIYKIQEEGKVVVIITVDRLGNVINAIPGAHGSTTLNSYLLKRAKEAALKTKFNAKKSAPENQQGKIIYHFNLK